MPFLSYAAQPQSLNRFQLFLCQNAHCRVIIWTFIVLGLGSQMEQTSWFSKLNTKVIVKWRFKAKIEIDFYKFSKHFFISAYHTDTFAMGFAPALCVLNERNNNDSNILYMRTEIIVKPLFLGSVTFKADVSEEFPLSLTFYEHY